MTVFCRGCGAIINTPPILINDMPIIGAPGREEIEYQATIAELVKHANAEHPEALQVFAGTAQTYLMHLYAKMAETQDEKFNQLREESKRVCYWTLAGDMEVTKNAPNLTPGQPV
jgi:hypothetical protein